jgi:translocator assembly and maintenance protein 41
MIDFIFGVSCSQKWHSVNLQQHRDHYSGIGRLGAYAVAHCQDSFGAGIYFHPFITINGILIKYGVVNLDTLCCDLLTWDTLYLAGRLQKPTRVLQDHPRVQQANQSNLASAINVALLLLPETFTEHDLYATIAGISYTGDPRMSVGGDDPQKIQNMIRYQLQDFRRLYRPLLKTYPNISSIGCQLDRIDFTESAKIQQSMDPLVRAYMLRSLPSAFRQKLYSQYRKKLNISWEEYRDLLQQLDGDSPKTDQKLLSSFEERVVQDIGLRQEVEHTIRKTVRWSSFTQSIKSAITAGSLRSWKYAAEKRRKAMLGVGSL